MNKHKRLKKNENNNYEDAYEEWEDKFGNEKNKGRW